ncbi:hypothetical protein BBO99_00001984 [Phytophthora kernoviae]|uniref:Uncharacterized protein n=1 Tax=Phytophthora kernoviae TaxID=325452 RepID=A0A421F2I7_9STRA|nr:hypothetical protein JM16_001665 [Phytophthora kernoviae]RLN20216.1 hypothetical protein BBI17_001966 [Phytophthora kernoviae]RLN83563.1 hypothetical protein BBO99_00001984 [Phytophthora kernoviae]
MLWRLNSYQYGSASAFLLDLEQLERVTDSEDQKQQVKALKDRLAVSEGARQDEESVGTAEYVSGGVKVTVCSSSVVPGLQEARSTGTEEGEVKTWLCNVAMGDQIVTVGTYESQEKALEGYQEQCSLKAKSFPKLNKLAARVEADQREEDKRILKEAVAQCHPRLTSLKASALANSAALAAANTSGPLRALPRSDSKRLVATSASSPVASPVPSEVAVSPPRHALRSTSSAKRQKVETASNAAASTDRREQNETKWRPSGRLEAGKVYSFRRKKQMTFADYVRDELGRAESACAHMFLVQEKANIDDHLKVCNAFSDKERDSPVVRSHVQAATSKTRKSSHRAH